MQGSPPFRMPRADAGFRGGPEAGSSPPRKCRYAAGAISMTGGCVDPRLPTEIAPPPSPECWASSPTADEVRKAAREQLRLGADYIKVSWPEGLRRAPPTSLTRSSTLPRSWQPLSTRRRPGNGAHPQLLHPEHEDVRRSGVHSIEHGNYLDRETARILREHGRWLVPTMATTRSWPQGARNSGILSYFLRKMKEVQKHSENALAIAFEGGTEDRLGLRHGGLGAALQGP